MGKNPTGKIGGALVVYHKDLSLVGNATRRDSEWAVKDGAEIAVQIRAERSSPRIGNGTNCRGSASN